MPQSKEEAGAEHAVSRDEIRTGEDTEERGGHGGRRVAALRESRAISPAAGAIGKRDIKTLGEDEEVGVFRGMKPQRGLRCERDAVKYERGRGCSMGMDR